MVNHVSLEMQKTHTETGCVNLALQIRGSQHWKHDGPAKTNVNILAAT